MPESESSRTGPSSLCSGASRRANASALATSSWSPAAREAASRTRSAVTAACPSGSSAGSMFSRSRVGSSSSSQRSGRSSTVTPCTPSSGIRWLPGGRRPPSTRTSDVRGRGPLVGAEARPVREVGGQHRGQVVERGGDHPAGAEGVAVLGALRVRQPLEPVPLRQRRRRRRARPTTRSSGEWKAATEQTIARARARACAASPVISTRPNARRSSAAGRFGCTRCTTSSRCSAEAATGSSCSIGAVSGGTSSSASGCEVRP